MLCPCKAEFSRMFWAVPEGIEIQNFEFFQAALTDGPADNMSLAYASCRYVIWRCWWRESSSGSPG